MRQKISEVTDSPKLVERCLLAHSVLKKVRPEISGLMSTNQAEHHKRDQAIDINFENREHNKYLPDLAVIMFTMLPNPPAIILYHAANPHLHVDYRKGRFRPWYGFNHSGKYHYVKFPADPAGMKKIKEHFEIILKTYGRNEIYEQLQNTVNGEGEKNPMNKKVITGIVAGCVVIAGIAFYLVKKKGEENGQDNAVDSGD